MIDEIVSKNLKSRKIHFYTDNLILPDGASPTEAVTWGKLKTFLGSDAIPCDMQTNGAGISIPGTPLNKDNLLSEAAESAVWGSASGTSRTPSDAFVKLGSEKLDKTGGVISGDLSIEGNLNPNTINFSSSSRAKFYVDDALVASMNAGGVAHFYGEAIFEDGIEANNKRIASVATPVDNADAANKGYVDEKFNQALEAGAVVFITARVTQGSTGPISCSATYDQIVEYLDNEKYVIVKFYSNQSTEYPYYGLVVWQGTNKIDFLIKTFNFDKILRCSKSGNDTNLYLYDRKPLEVNISRTQDQGLVNTINASFAEILDAYNNSRQIIVKSAGIYGGSNLEIYSTTGRSFDVMYDSSLNTFTFSMLCIVRNIASTPYRALREIKFILDSNDTVTFDNGLASEIKSA